MKNVFYLKRCLMNGYLVVCLNAQLNMTQWPINNLKQTILK